MIFQALKEIHFFVLGLAADYGQQLGFESGKLEFVLQEMQSGTYDNLLTVFLEHFGDIVQLVSPHELKTINSDLYTIDKVLEEYI